MKSTFSVIYYLKRQVVKKDGTVPVSMTDKERMDVVERCYSKMKRYRNLVSYYTNKNISVSYLRAKKKNDLDRIMGLYGNMNERYW